MCAPLAPAPGLLPLFLQRWGLLADPSDHDSAQGHALGCQQHPPLPIVPKGSGGHVLAGNLGQVHLGAWQQVCSITFC